MQAVSNLFKSNIYAIERTIDGKALFELLDVQAYDDASFTVSGKALISRLAQIINKIRDTSYKYGTFEPNYFLLDGNTFIPPKENEGDSEVSWWSDVISGADGVYTTQPTLQFTFTEPHSSAGLTLTFDKKANEFPSEFKIEVFDATDTLIYSQLITGNTDVLYYYDQNLDNYKRILITIIKSAVPYRRARIIEVDFGIVREYTGDTLISMNVVEETDLLSSTVPSNEMQFTVSNADQYFNILNPNGVYRYLKINQEMSAQLGLLIGEEKYEYISLGKYYLSEWTVDEGAMTATLIGRDIFSQLEAIIYTNSIQQTNLHALAVDVLTDAGITNYQIDAKLLDRATFGFRDSISTREALQLIAIAGRSVIKQNRNGTIVIEQLDELKPDTGYITFAGTDTYAGMTTPQVDTDYTFQGIDFDNVYEVPKVTLSSVVSELIINLVDYSNVESVVTITNPNVTKGERIEINNPLINTQEHAQWVADWMFREYSLFADYEANWRQNPALEPMDIIIVEDSFDNVKKSRIIKQEYRYEGYLEGTTTSKGGV